MHICTATPTWSALFRSLISISKSAFYVSPQSSLMDVQATSIQLNYGKGKPQRLSFEMEISDLQNESLDRIGCTCCKHSL